MLEVMQRFGYPMTREGYLKAAYGHDVPELDAEGEMGLPSQFRRGQQ